MTETRTSTASREQAAGERLRRILETAAQLICRHGYEATSMQRIADACGLTKAGLYHHVQSKEHLLLEIMTYGMDAFEEQVLLPISAIADPRARLAECMRRHILLVTRGRNKEVTVILHEQDTLTGAPQARINARKKHYIRFLEGSFREAIRRGQLREVDPKVAAFAFLGTINWIYKWFRPDGEIPGDRLAVELPDLFFRGLEPGGAAAGETP